MLAICATIARACRAPAKQSDNWAGWNHIAYNGVADSKKRERKERKRKEERERERGREGKRHGRGYVRSNATKKYTRFMQIQPFL